VRLVLAALGDPVAEQFLFVVAECLAGIGRRHHVVLVAGGDAGNQLALARGAGYHRRIIAEISQRALEGVQAQIGLAMAGIRPVALETFVRENRANVAIEPNLTGTRHAGGDGEGQCREKSMEPSASRVVHSRDGDSAKKSETCHTCAWLSVGMAFAQKMPVFCSRKRHRQTCPAV